MLKRLAKEKLPELRYKTEAGSDLGEKVENIIITWNLGVSENCFYFRNDHLAEKRDDVWRCKQMVYVLA